jgi:2-keto-4-pentenoate hydratase/2-oxohepta-3-ene-1,7-dioic acid hydratase in catechol pathway
VVAFKLLSYAGDKGPRAGVLVEDTVFDLRAALEQFARAHGLTMDFDGGSVLSVLESWDTARSLIADVAAEYGRGDSAISREVGQSLASTRLLAPILYPGAIYGACANYVDHAREMRGADPPDKATNRPAFFLKTSRQSVIGPREPIRLRGPLIDWEAELGVVIGRTADRVSAADAMQYVAGYTIVNDLSDKSQSRRTDQYGQWFGVDWFRIKCFDGSAPMGPWITPVDAIPDPHDVAIQLWVNDQLMQDGSSRLMHFSIPEQIEYLSEQLRLRPGDVISTGTCTGVGATRNVYLKPGDHIRISMAGLGTLENPVQSAE